MTVASCARHVSMRSHRHALSPSLPRAASRSAVATVALASLLVVSGCTTTETEGPQAIRIGTTDEMSALDPAGSFDDGSRTVQSQIFPYLVALDADGRSIVPDLAQEAGFTSATQYTVTLPSGLSWSNGDDLTSSDVKFSFDRQLAIADADGPSSLLANLASVDAPDDETVVFTLRSDNDQSFPLVLASAAGAIVDEEVFRADRVTDDDDIVDGDAFGGPYTIADLDVDGAIEFAPNPEYRGLIDAPVNDSVVLSFYDSSTELADDVAAGTVDVATGTLAASDVAGLRDDDTVVVHEGPGGETRMLAFDVTTMPFGSATAGADAAKAQAVRQAAASLVDRAALADQVFSGGFSPLLSVVPTGLGSTTAPFRTLYGDGQGGPDAATASEALAAAAVTTPVALTIGYASDDLYGAESEAEYELLAGQLEAGGLFTVDLVSSSSDAYAADIAAGTYQAFQVGLDPRLPDVSAYLTPIVAPTGGLGGKFTDAATEQLVSQQAVQPDAVVRDRNLVDAEERIAELVPAVPLLQGLVVVVAATDVDGVDLGASGVLRFALLSS